MKTVKRYLRDTKQCMDLIVVDGTMTSFADSGKDAV